MARSGSTALAIALAALSVAASGCESTQLANERAKLRATREVASRQATRVTRPTPDVEVTDVAVVRGRRSSAIVVSLRSRVPRPLTDLPITVGVRERGRRGRLLNARPALPWFRTHVPAIPANGTTTWVLSGGRRLPAGARAFARVGPPSPAVSHPDSLPRIEAQPAVRGTAPRVRVENTSDIPQYGLQVYAVVRDGRRFVAAGAAAVDRLGKHDTATVAVPLTGAATTRSPEVTAVPTIFN